MEAQTPLDKTMHAAVANPELADDYYTLFLNTEFFIPVWTTEDELEEKDGKVEVQPVVIEQGEIQYIAAFDTRDRLKSWADREINVTAVRGYDLLTMIKPYGFLLSLNEGTGHTKTFDQDEIDWLLENASPTA